MNFSLLDLRYAWRSLRAKPGFAVTAVLTLALGIGASTAAYSFAHWMLWRPIVGVDDPDQLAIAWSGPSIGPGRVSPLRYEDVEVIAQRATAVSGLAGYQRGAGGYNVAATVGAEPFARRVGVHHVTANYFAVLGVKPLLGRVFVPEDDAPPAGSAVALISHALWRSLLAADSGALGRDIQINDQPYTLVGVLPEGFNGIERGGEVGVWLPGRTLESARLGGYYELVLRIAPGRGFRQAATQLRTAVQAVEQSRGAPPEFAVGPVLLRGIGVPPLARSRVKAATQLALFAALTVLVIACANVANLLLFRSISRRATIALRRMLGAGGADLIRIQLLESMVLALPAALIGALAASWLVRVFEGTSLVWGTDPLGRIPLSLGALGFASAAAMVSSLVAAAYPALAATRTEAFEAARASGSAFTRGGARVRRTFSVVQLSLSLALLAVAFLLVRTLKGLNAVDLGFDPEGVMVAEIDIPRETRSTAQAQSYYRELLAGVRGAPGIEAAALAWKAPFMGLTRIRHLPAPAVGGETEIGARLNTVSPSYFSVFNMRFVAGRAFTEDESDKTVVTSALARRLAGGDEAVLGHQVPPSGGSSAANHEVVGVVANTRWEAVEESGGSFLPAEPLAMMFVPFRGGTGLSVLLARSALQERAAIQALRRVAAEVDPAVPLYGVTTMTELIRRHLSERILFARVLSGLSVLALIMAAIGLYGVLAFGVAARVREFGIRMALGAQRATILRMVLSEAVILASLGGGLGVLGGIAIGRVIQSRLYGVGFLDPPTYGAAVLVLFLVAVGAGVIPGRAATLVDPVVSLRAE